MSSLLIPRSRVSALVQPPEEKEKGRKRPQRYAITMGFGLASFQCAGSLCLFGGAKCLSALEVDRKGRA